MRDCGEAQVYRVCSNFPLLADVCKFTWAELRTIVTDDDNQYSKPSEVNLQLDDYGRGVVLDR